MKVEHISSSLFTLELSPEELSHVLSLSKNSSERLVELVKLWCEIGFYTSTAIEKGIDDKCEQKKSLENNLW